MQTRIAVCGAPVVGKTTLVSQLARRTKSDCPISKSTELEVIVRADIPSPQGKTTLITLAGSFFYHQSTVLDWLLKDIHGVIYVIGALPSNRDTDAYPDEEQQEGARQALFWDLYTRHAARLRSSWSSIPWIFVLNNIDRGTTNPLLRHIPVQFHDQILPCSATQSLGIDQLWTRIRVISRWWETRKKMP